MFQCSAGNVNVSCDNEQDTVVAAAAAAAADDDDDGVDDDDNDADENDINERATTQTTAIFVIQFHFLFIYVLINSLFFRYKNRTRIRL